jgi:toxin ParE1/3/4
MFVWWSTPATQQLSQAYEYIAAENESSAKRIVNHIWNSVELLERHPYAGRRGRIGGTRELVIRGTPFVIAYIVGGNEVRILAVLHAARKWPEEF